MKIKTAVGKEREAKRFEDTPTFVSTLTIGGTNSGVFAVTTEPGGKFAYLSVLSNISRGNPVGVYSINPRPEPWPGPDYP